MSWLDTGAPNAGHSVDCPVFHSSFPCVSLLLSLTFLLSSSPVPSFVLFPLHFLTSTGTLRWQRDCRLSVAAFTGHVRYPHVCMRHLCHCWEILPQLQKAVLSLESGIAWTSKCVAWLLDAVAEEERTKFPGSPLSCPSPSLGVGE